MSWGPAKNDVVVHVRLSVVAWAQLAAAVQLPITRDGRYCEDPIAMRAPRFSDGQMLCVVFELATASNVLPPHVARELRQLLPVLEHGVVRCDCPTCEGGATLAWRTWCACGWLRNGSEALATKEVAAVAMENHLVECSRVPRG